MVAAPLRKLQVRFPDKSEIDVRLIAKYLKFVSHFFVQPGPDRHSQTEECFEQVGGLYRWIETNKIDVSRKVCHMVSCLLRATANASCSCHLLKSQQFIQKCKSFWILCSPSCSFVPLSSVPFVVWAGCFQPRVCSTWHSNLLQQQLCLQS